MKIFDVFTIDNIVGYINQREATADQAYLGASLFPNVRTVGLDLTWISQLSGVPVALRPSTFDVKAEMRDRIGVSKIDTELMFFKEGMKIKERERQELLKINLPYAQPIIDSIFNDIYNLAAGVEVQAERARMQLLTAGTISISVDGAAYYYDYGFKSGHKSTLLSTAVWSDLDDSDPIANIEAWCDTLESEGYSRPTRAICNNAVWGYLRNNEKIGKAINPVGFANGGKYKPEDIRQYISDFTGVTIAVYDKTYKAEVNGAAVKYIPNKTFTLIPDGMLGETYYGTTPEEADLMSGAEAQVQVLTNGAAVKVFKEPDPVNVNTVVSDVLLPSFPSIDNVFIATVAS